MTKKQKDMLEAYSGDGSAVCGTGGSRSYENDLGSIYRLEDAIFVSHPLFCDRLGYPL